MSLGMGIVTKTTSHLAHVIIQQVRGWAFHQYVANFYETQNKVNLRVRMIT